MKTEEPASHAESQVPAPKPSRPAPPQAGRHEAQVESEERTPEEAGYGYGV